MHPVTIYHNPACSTSRKTLELIRNHGIEPMIVLYLETPPNKTTLKKLIAEMKISARALLRDKEEIYKQLGLAENKWSDDQLIDMMVAHPKLINRPIVVTPLGVRLCRPIETALEILPKD